MFTAGTRRLPVRWPNRGSGGRHERAGFVACRESWWRLGPEVRAAFERAMRDVYVRAKKEANYTASYFLTMLSDTAVSGQRIGY